ncbi:MAG: DUF6340 family protein [Planctomycetaceae bacterium]
MGLLCLMWVGQTCFGCAQMAMVRCWEPATIDVAGMDRLAVVSFRGVEGEHVAAALHDRLWENHFFALVDASELTTLQHAAYVPDSCDQALLAQARERGIDGIIFGVVEEHRCEDTPIEKVASGMLSAAAEHVGSAGEAATPRGLTRHGEVVVAFQLVDARTGEVRTESRARHVYDETSRSAGSDLPGEEQILTQLTTMCLDDFVEELTPHQSELPMELASVRWYGPQSARIRGANRLAMQGDWDAARDVWQEVADQNWNNDAALFNLAIDAAHRQQYSRAEELAMQALKLRHTEQYADGLAQIREYRSGYDAVARQRDRRVLQASR